MAFASLLVINGVEITDDGRTITDNTDMREVTVELANGDTKKYRKAVKHNFSLSWDWLPGINTINSDLKVGRDALAYLVAIGGPYICQVRYTDDAVVTFYAWIEDYKEELLRRDTVSNTVYWNVSFGLKER